MLVRDAGAADFARILRLNEESVHFLSPMDRDRLQSLHAMAAYHRVLADARGQAIAFLLALREGCAYDSPNYGWFARRLPRFLYIDRVVIAAQSQGRRLGRVLYDDLLAHAHANGVETVTCEFDTDPPNEPSRRFHASYGFRQIGTHRVGASHKEVGLQALQIGAGMVDPGAWAVPGAI